MSKVTKHTHYHKDGSIWAKGSMLNGKMHGSWTWFRKDGSKMRSGSFDKDKQVGTWTTYDKTGKVVKVTQMKTLKTNN
jgi:antitoxin component YwqK of YwqJK toxin-antitoxin module